MREITVRLKVGEDVKFCEIDYLGMVYADRPRISFFGKDNQLLHCRTASEEELMAFQIALKEVKSPYTYETISTTDYKGEKYGKSYNFRIRDSEDNRIATCWDELNARFLVRMLNTAARFLLFRKAFSEEGKTP